MILTIAHDVALEMQLMDEKAGKKKSLLKLNE